MPAACRIKFAVYTPACELSYHSACVLAFLQLRHLQDVAFLDSAVVDQVFPALTGGSRRREDSQQLHEPHARWRNHRHGLDPLWLGSPCTSTRIP